MKYFAIALFTILFSGSVLSGEVIVTKADKGKTIEAKVGDVIKIELKHNPSGGYLWKIKDLDQGYFENPTIVTVPSQRVWEIKAKKAGTSNLRILYFRPWEGEKMAIDEFNATVTIKP